MVLKTVKTLFYQFSMGDVEDPEIYASAPIWEWQQTEHGRWCMENSIDDPQFTVGHDYNTYGYKCSIWGQLTEKDYTYHQLKWNNHVNYN